MPVRRTTKLLLAEPQGIFPLPLLGNIVQHVEKVIGTAERRDGGRPPLIVMLKFKTRRARPAFAHWVVPSRMKSAATPKTLIGWLVKASAVCPKY